MKDRADSPFGFIERRCRRRRIIAGALLVISALWLFRPHWHADESLIDPRLRSLEKPYKWVSVTDTSSQVLVELAGADGRTERFSVRNGSVYVQEGEIWRSSSDPSTLQELAAIVADDCSNSGDYAKLAAITGRPGDYIVSKVCHGWEFLRDSWKGW